MNVLHLRYFYEVARTGGFSQASRNLRISQPAISKMVRLLESDLGYRLIERSRRGLSLTQEGRRVFDGAALIFAEVRRIEESLERGLPELKGPWGLGASDNIAIHLVPPVLGAFKTKHPGLDVSLFSGTSGQIKDELRFDRCNLGLVFTPPAASEPFQCRQVHETEFWAVIARRNRWFRRGAVSLAELKRAKVPRIESRHSDYARGFPAHFHSRKLGLTEAPWLQTNQHEVKKRLVLAGYGFALLTRHTVEKEVERGELIRVDYRRQLGAPIYAVWNRGRRLDRASERFLEGFGAAMKSRAG